MLAPATLPSQRASRASGGAEHTDVVLTRKLRALTAGFGGDVGIYVRQLRTGATVAIDADSVFPTASMIKVPLLITLYDQAEQGKLDLESIQARPASLEYKYVEPTDVVGYMRTGDSLPLAELAFLMLTVSDNVASLWIQALEGGGQAANAWLAAHGFDSTRVNSRTPGREASRGKYGWGQTTPREMSRALVMIREGRAVSPRASEAMYRALTKSYWSGNALSQIPPTVVVASKQGFVDHSRSETVLVNAPTGDYVLTIGTKRLRDTTYAPSNEAHRLIRAVSRTVYEHFNPNDRWRPFPEQAAVRTGAMIDSLLVARILLAEDRRDSADVALNDGVRSGDARVRTLARRAIGRIRDPHYAIRDTVAGAPPLATWPEPAWRLRYRALGAAREDCGALRTALADSAWTVRLRAADLLGPTCAADSVIASTLHDWIDRLPVDVSRRAADQVSWHAAAHALVALARTRPADARVRMPSLAAHRQWQLRMYAARAATVLGDSATLAVLSRDANDNVREAAIDGLAKVAPAGVPNFTAALDASAPQVVRAAALALAKNGSADVVRRANAAFERWVRRGNASERDVRVALLAAAGRPAGDDRPPAPKHELPPQAVALALGADVRVRVQMSPASGGGSFVVRLRGDAAPLSAARVLALVRQHYYDGLSWHRVEPDFVIQGGSPGANEYVGASSYLRDELGTLSHQRGTIGMSTRGHDTGDAQWFINLKDNPRLTADYTVFGDVVEGMGVVDGVLEGDVIERIDVVASAP